ncbi:MAG: hypothetical protein FWF70_03260, partial [Bacteroidetes bacterium]|nr:hypothetical protein [Bacteroidota bacterium]
MKKVLIFLCCAFFALFSVNAQQMKKFILFIGFLLLGMLSQINGQQLIGPTGTQVLNVRGISSNGTYVVGQTYNEPREGFTWNTTAGNAVIQMGSPRSEAYDVNDNNIVAGDFADPSLLWTDPEEGLYNVPIRSAGVWQNGNWRSLGLGILTGSPVSYTCGSHATCITTNGNTVAGFCMTYPGGVAHVNPYSWTYSEITNAWTGELWNEPANADQGSSIIAISGNGTVAVGWTHLGTGFAMRTGILWTSKTQFRIFSYGDPAAYSEFLCVSKNGKWAGFRYGVIAGVYDIENDEYFLIPQGRNLNGITNNGFAVGDYLNSWERYKGFVWSKNLGFMTMNDFRLMYAPSVPMNISVLNGFDPNTQNDLSVQCISADGLSIPIRTGNRAFVLRFPSPIVIYPIPQNLNATVSRSDRNKVILTWEVPEVFEEAIDHYAIYRDGVEIGQSAASILTYTDENVASGYPKYSVQAVYASNHTSAKTEAIEVMIVDNYNLPFFEDFNTPLGVDGLRINYWTNMSARCNWYGIFDAGVANSGSAILEVTYAQTTPFSGNLISKPLDARAETNLYLTYSFGALCYMDNHYTNDTLYVDISTDGINWTNVNKYEFNETITILYASQINWRTEFLDISNVAAGELFNVRFRIEGLNISSNNRYYVLDNVSITTTAPTGTAIPLNLVGKIHNTNLELAWQNPEELYGLTYQQTPYLYAFGNEGNNIICVQSFDAEQLEIYEGSYLVSISAYINKNVNNPSVPTALKLAVYADGVRIVNQDVTTIISNSINTFILNSPIPLSTITNNLKIGIEVVSHDVNELPIGADAQGSGVAEKGDLFSEDGGVTWQSLSNLPNTQYHRNWCIIGNVSHPTNTAIRTNDILGYNVYFDGTKINNYLLFGQSFITAKNAGRYAVRAISLTSGISDTSVNFVLLPTYNVNVLSSNINWGTVTGGGEDISQGTQITVTATAFFSYEFINWTKDGVVVSTSSSYTFTVTETMTLVANFQPGTYTLTSSVNGSNGTISPLGATTVNYGGSQ